MTRFNPEKNRKTPQQWSAIALSATKDNHLQWNVIGGLVLGALAASAASPLTGSLVAAYFLWDSWKKAGEIQRNQAAIAQLGCVAQVLDGDDFADYTRQVGHVAVVAELEFAFLRGLALSAAAADFLEDNYSSPALPPSKSLMTIAKTLLGKHGLQVELESEEEIYSNPDDNFDIIASMTDRISNSFILGIGGTGKNIVVSNALRAAKVKHPKLKVFYIDPKHDKKEQGYTTGVADVIKRYKCQTEEPSVVVAWLEKCLEEFNKYAKANDAKQERTLLVLDEGTVLGLKCKIAKSTILLDRLSSLTSLGDSAGKNIWFIAQTPFVGGSGIDLSASSQLVTIALVSAENRGSLDQWRRSAGMLATYGLRNHEIFRLDFGAIAKGDYIVTVGENSKTGSRRVWPCYSEWFEEFNLQEVILPKVNIDRPNADVGHVVTKWFHRHLPFQPYDLRHCWAIRTLEFGLDISLASQQMGHSTQVHSELYHHWISERHHQRAFELMMHRSERPQAPIVLGHSKK